MSEEGNEKREFRAEVCKVLHIPHPFPLYKPREIFSLRELISNASDALDKVRFPCKPRRIAQIARS